MKNLTKLMAKFEEIRMRILYMNSALKHSSEHGSKLRIHSIESTAFSFELSGERMLKVRNLIDTFIEEDKKELEPIESVLNGISETIGYK